MNASQNRKDGERPLRHDVDERSCRVEVDYRSERDGGLACRSGLSSGSSTEWFARRGCKRRFSSSDVDKFFDLRKISNFDTKTQGPPTDL
jgi:hypothetical protein